MLISFIVINLKFKLLLKIDAQVVSDFFPNCFNFYRVVFLLLHNAQALCKRCKILAHICS